MSEDSFSFFLLPRNSPAGCAFPFFLQWPGANRGDERSTPVWALKMGSAAADRRDRESHTKRISGKERKAKNRKEDLRKQERIPRMFARMTQGFITGLILVHP